MNILILTNTYLPHVGGVARVVEEFAAEYRRRGHRVLIVAPDFPDAPKGEEGVVRVPAIQKFNGSDFSVRIPLPRFLASATMAFGPDIVHSHHPFLLGDTAARIAARHNVPLVFTHNTMYERYTHYVPGDSPSLQRFVVDLTTGYANLCDQVFAPSQSVAMVLRDRGVESPIAVVPSGVHVARFARGDGAAVRRYSGIPPEAFVVGHVGRLAPEKNLSFLAEAVVAFLRARPDARFVLVGKGPSEPEIGKILARHSVAARLHYLGVAQGQALVDAYHAMHTETQGLVLVEAMACGLPVVAVDAPGVREVVVDEVNGRSLPRDHVEQFAQALAWIATRTPPEREALRRSATQTAARFSISACADRALSCYDAVLRSQRARRMSGASLEDTAWASALRLVETEWHLWSNRLHAVGRVVGESVSQDFGRWIPPRD